MPSLWKLSHITPIPKKPHPTCLNDYRPIALTSIAMKCMERIILGRLLNDIRSCLDPLQFAYRARRGVEDAVITVLDKVYDHLEKPNSYARILFVDFSSAFNTIKPHLLIRKLIDMDVNTAIVKWIADFLTNRTQYVQAKTIHSSTLSTSTGAPQGCVLSPVLFTTYTNDCTAHQPGCSLIKFADDAALVALLTNTEHHYREEVVQFTDWCQHNGLLLNVSKTKELIIDFRSKKMLPLITHLLKPSRNINIWGLLLTVNSTGLPTLTLYTLNANRDCIS